MRAALLCSLLIASLVKVGWAAAGSAELVAPFDIGVLNEVDSVQAEVALSPAIDLFKFPLGILRTLMAQYNQFNSNSNRDVLLNQVKGDPSLRNTNDVASGGMPGSRLRQLLINVAHGLDRLFLQNLKTIVGDSLQKAPGETKLSEEPAGGDYRLRVNARSFSISALQGITEVQTVMQALSGIAMKVPATISRDELQNLADFLASIGFVNGLTVKKLQDVVAHFAQIMVEIDLEHLQSVADAYFAAVTAYGTNFLVTPPHSLIPRHQRLLNVCKMTISSGGYRGTAFDALLQSVVLNGRDIARYVAKGEDGAGNRLSTGDIFDQVFGFVTDAIPVLPGTDAGEVFRLAEVFALTRADGTVDAAVGFSELMRHVSELVRAVFRSGVRKEQDARMVKAAQWLVDSTAAFLLDFGTIARSAEYEHFFAQAGGILVFPWQDGSANLGDAAATFGTAVSSAADILKLRALKGAIAASLKKAYAVGKAGDAASVVSTLFSKASGAFFLNGVVEMVVDVQTGPRVLSLMQNFVQNAPYAEQLVEYVQSVGSLANLYRSMYVRAVKENLGNRATGLIQTDGSAGPAPAVVFDDDARSHQAETDFLITASMDAVANSIGQRPTLVFAQRTLPLVMARLRSSSAAPALNAAMKVYDLLKALLPNMKKDLGGEFYGNVKRMVARLLSLYYDGVISPEYARVLNISDSTFEELKTRITRYSTERTQRNMKEILSIVVPTGRLFLATEVDEMARLIHESVQKVSASKRDLSTVLNVCTQIFVQAVVDKAASIDSAVSTISTILINALQNDISPLLKNTYVVFDMLAYGKYSNNDQTMLADLSTALIDQIIAFGTQKRKSPSHARPVAPN